MKNILFFFILYALLVHSVWSQKTVYFQANKSWNSTGYTYTAGQELFLYAFGAHADNPNNDNWVETPAGDNFIPTSNHPLNGVPENSLIGKIGINGTPFYIGNGGKMVLSESESGELYLEVNDALISNNLGTIFLHIMKKPNFTVYFQANKSWNSTGYTYTAGQELFLYAFGAHADNPNNDNWVETPAGDNFIPTSNHPLNGVPENSLIGKIGINGTPFYIGNGGKMVLSGSESGELYLEVNDALISNNLGTIFLHVFEEFSLSVNKYIDKKIIFAYPNPVNNSLKIVYPNPLKEKFNIQITDIYGRIVYKTIYDNNFLNLSLDNLQSGVYLLSIIDLRGRLINTKKIIKK